MVVLVDSAEASVSPVDLGEVSVEEDSSFLGYRRVRKYFYEGLRNRMSVEKMRALG